MTFIINNLKVAAKSSHNIPGGVESSNIQVAKVRVDINNAGKLTDCTLISLMAWTRSTGASRSSFLTLKELDVQNFFHQA